MFEIDSALRTLVERGGSDLHVKVAAPPTIRLHGELTPLEGHEPLSDEETERALHAIAEAFSLAEFERPRRCRRLRLVRVPFALLLGLSPARPLRARRHSEGLRARLSQAR